MIVELSEKLLYKRANELCKKEEYEKALRLYQRLENENATDWRYSNMQGYCYMFLEDYETARSCFIRAKNAGGLASTIANNMAWSYIEEEQYLLAKEQIEAVIKDYPFDPYLHINMAKSMHGLKRHKEAIYYFEKTIQLQPNFYDAYFGLGLDYYDVMDYKKAADCFVQFLKHNDCMDSLYFLSKCYLELENYVEHIKIANKLIIEDQDDVEILLDRAYSYHKLGSVLKAEKDLRHVLKIDPENEEAIDMLEQK